MTSPRPPRHVQIVISADESFADVTVDGEVRRISGELPKQTRRRALEVATSLAAATGSDVIIEASDGHSSWRLLATPQGVVRELREQPAAQQKRLPVRGIVVLGVVGLAVVALGAAVAARLPLALPSFSETDDEQPQDERGLERDVELTTRAAPPGFSANAEWRMALTGGTTPAVSPDGGGLAVVTEEESLVVLGPDGERVWSEPFTVDVDDLVGILRFVPLEDGLHVAAVTEDTLWLWPEKGGAPAELELPADAYVTFVGGSPLVTRSDETPMIPRDGELVDVPVPEDARPVAFDGERVLASSDDGSWMTVRPEEDPAPVRAEDPADAGDPVAVLTATTEHVVMEWEADDDAASILAVHNAQDGSVIGAAAVEEDDRSEDDRWEAAESWGAYGALLIDLDEGETEILSDFQPVGAAGEVLYGDVDGVLTAIDAEGTSSELADDTARPWGHLEGRAVVVAEQDVYVLPPD